MTTTTTRTKCIAAGCETLATNRPQYPEVCWRHTPSEDNHYPVLVTYTQRHVVWVEAEDAAAAVESMQTEPYEMTNDQETLADASWEVESPEKYDWSLVEYGGYYMPYRGIGEHDAHVKAHIVATCPHSERYEAGTCKACGHWQRVTS